MNDPIALPKFLCEKRYDAPILRPGKVVVIFPRASGYTIAKRFWTRSAKMLGLFERR